MVRKDAKEGKKRPSFELDDKREKEVMSSSVSGIFDWNPSDKNGFNQKNTNIYLKKGETAELVLIPHLTASGKLTTNPFVINMHNLLMKTKEGKPMYPKELCLKEFGQSCPLCDASISSDNIHEARPKLFYMVLDTRGTRTRDGFDTSKNQVGFINVPTAIFKQIKDQEDKLGDLSWLIFEFKKDSTGTFCSPITKRVEAGMFSVVTYEGEEPKVLPDFGAIYGVPRPEEHYTKLVEIITK